MIDRAEHEFLTGLRTHCHQLQQHAAAAVEKVENRVAAALGGDRAATAGASPDGAAPDLDIHEVRLMIERELALSGLDTNPPLMIDATLSLKVTTAVTAGVSFSVSIWGIGGGAGASRTSANTRTVTLSFAPGTEAGQAGPCKVVGRSGDELSQELTALKQMLPPNDEHWSKAEIDVDFTLTTEADAKAVIYGKFEEDSTHTLQLTLTKPA